DCVVQVTGWTIADRLIVQIGSLDPGSGDAAGLQLHRAAVDRAVAHSVGAVAGEAVNRVLQLAAFQHASRELNLLGEIFRELDVPALLLLVPGGGVSVVE